MKISVNGLAYHVEVCGKGEPLLLLHGFTGSSGTWLPFCEKWGRHSMLICPDLPGHGNTESPDEPVRYSMENTIEDLCAILDKLEVERANVLGYSMGGRIALGFASARPGRVGKLVLESSSPGLDTEEERINRRMKDSELANFIKEQGIEAFVDYWQDIPLFKSLQEMPEPIRKGTRAQRLTNSPVGLANSLLGIGTGAQPSYWDSLHSLDADVMLLAGELDEKFIGIAEKVSQRLKSSRIEIIEGTGHAIHVENPEKFGTIVSGFLTHT
ncbi:2-succinyl-6-hydroxy-2,4-cyclohexadiene-1-carboxylate synthase [Bacillus sp. B-jedd]|uniref:2-succinyl-6-hydroxy-2, 4-cyclohexadiene-1-carboxylate synthase n=1 Tax=Bacillus sp. B-jedd TaxID=1476857 RepID=UPI0005156426|nr:2-succinyl-6-hydroxy-2,4-cyclohexadiene-1-carboxylate synthase [Bacillus sp. B-jedd]CEG28302.1 alpha/beta hydrolase [Bacillus sp. B-jedd]